MKIGLELRQIVPGASGGIVQHLQGVLNTLFREYPEHEYHLFTTIYNRRLFPKMPLQVRVYSLPAASFFEDIDRTIRSEGIEVLFRSFPMAAPLEFPLLRQVFLIPDVQHEVFPQFFAADVLERRRRDFDQALSWAGAIGTNTRHARQEILDLPQTKVEDIFLMNPALVTQSSAGQLSAAEEALIPRGPYFYYPANLWPHKNHQRLLEAFELFLRQSPHPAELILSGHPEGWPALRERFAHLPVRHLGFVSSTLVQALLSRATALTFFSRYEGFGMPLLEAFAAGTPVLCSSDSSLQEVGGEAVLTCPPDDVQAMSQLMARLVNEPELHARLVEQGKQRLNEYSWEKSAQALNEAFLRVSQRAAERENQLAEMPLISIVTPSYNQGEFIRATIDSVLRQTYPNIEYWVIDGGSKDNTLEILRSYGERVKWISEPDRGQTHAINKGFERCSGQILAYLNSDDTLEPDAVETVARFFTTHPEIDMVYGRANYIDREGRITGQYNTADFSFERLMFDNCVCQPAAFWRRAIAEKCGPFDEDVHFSMDFEYWVRMDRCGGRLYHLPKVLANSRLYAETKTLSAREKIFQENIRISSRYTGKVHLNYFLGLWNHRIWEVGKGKYRWLRFPKSFLILANLHWLWYHRRSLTPAGLKSWLLAVIKQALGPQFGWLRPLRRRWMGRSFKVSADHPVFGLYEDNWTAPILQVYLRGKSAHSGFYLRGVPAVDTEIRIREENHTERTLRAKAGEEISIEFAAQAGERVQVHCLRTAPNEQGRFNALRITDTNLFSEDDAHF